jgi:hypothetical protein
VNRQALRDDAAMVVARSPQPPAEQEVSVRTASGAPRSRDEVITAR